MRNILYKKYTLVNIFNLKNKFFFTADDRNIIFEACSKYNIYYSFKPFNFFLILTLKYIIF